MMRKFPDHISTSYYDDAEISAEISAEIFASYDVEIVSAHDAKNSASYRRFSFTTLVMDP